MFNHVFGNSLVLPVYYLGAKDYIDLFLIHDPFSGTERRLATYQALLDAQNVGKIRSVGVSN
jgi:diketogulonate reductase-like aldo/keto reductase